MAADTIMSPVHPGEILAEEFLTPLGITQYRLAAAIGVPPRRINEIVDSWLFSSTTEGKFGESRTDWPRPLSTCAY
jgi:hypothetical protein